MEQYESQCLSALQETVIQQRAATLQREAVRLARQRAFLREERRKARQEEAAILEEKANLEHVGRPDWWPESYFKANGDCTQRLRLRVGGQLFEISKEVLCQDEYSLLAALCQQGSPANTSVEGSAKFETVVVDRDWWLFRFIVIFLRDGLVPDDRALALQLYREAAFWRLGTLQRAIEEAHLNLTRKDIKVEDGALVESAPPDKEKFWKQKKNWWEAAPEKKPAKKEKKPEWWLDDGGKEEKKKAGEEGRTLLSSTWGYRG